MEITNEAKLECMRRELKQRERVYPRLIQQRRMYQENADREIAVVKAIIEDYEALAQSERLL